MKRVRVPLGDRSYHICIGRGLLGRCGTEIKRLGLGTDAVVVTNSRLYRLYGRPLRAALRRGGLTTRFELVPDSEKAKSIEVAARLLNRISGYDVRRRLFIVAFGGGVIGDLAGFVAAVYKRGLPYVQIPTTLLAQVDSAIGGKVAIDLPAAKNLAGTVYQPKTVISDISLLRTLPPRHIRNGLAEVIKYGVIKDAGLFRFLESGCGRILRRDARALEHVIVKASRIKAAVVAQDEFDKTGVRAILNYGHTIGHAIEAAAGYSNTYNHGEAVAIGMVAASRIASALGIMKSSDARRVEALIRKAALPTMIRGLKFPAIYRAHLHDKKFIRGINRFVLPTRIGSVRVIEGVPESTVRNILKLMMS